MGRTEESLKKCRRLDRINRFLGVCLLALVGNLVLMYYGINIVSFIRDSIICKFI